MGKPESTEVAKEIVVKFLQERLNILSVETSDVDCAHRLGAIKNGKQIILTRFFRRDLADHAIRNKKMLKGTGMAVFEDSPQLSRDLMKELIGQPEVESTWYIGGNVWAKLKNGPKKYKFSINDNVGARVQRLYNNPITTPSLTPHVDTQATTGTQQPASAEVPQSTVNGQEQAAAANPDQTTSLTTTDVPPVAAGLTGQLPIDEKTRPVPPIRHRRPTATA